jgi:AraC-like DNA-binding protein
MGKKNVKLGTNMEQYLIDSLSDIMVDDAGEVIYTYPIYHPARFLNFHVMFYVYQGQIPVVLEGKEYHVNPGEVMFLPAHFHHYGTKLYTPDTRCHYIHFPAGPSDGIGEDENSAARHCFLLPPQSYDVPSEIFIYFQCLSKTIKFDSPYRERRCSALLLLILSGLSDAFRRRHIKKYPVIEDILILFEGHPQKFYTIPELIKFTGLKRRTLTGYFREAIGQPIHKYQINWKLERISRILRSHSFSTLNEMSLNFGFFDEYHLSSAFKKKYGVSPVRYSRIHAGG